MHQAGSMECPDGAEPGASSWSHGVAAAALSAETGAASALKCRSVNVEQLM